LGGPLLEEAPARVRLAVIAAAQAAAQKQATPAKVKQPSARDDLGFFARLWRTPWFLPAFGAASIATVVFLVRVLKNPEVLPGQRPHSVDERALVAPEPAPSPDPTMAAQPAAASAAEVKANADMNLEKDKGSGSAGRATKHAAAKGEMVHAQATAGLGAAEKRKSSEEMQGLRGSRRDKSQAEKVAPRQFAEPPAPRPGTKKSSKDIDDLMGGFRERESVQRQAQPQAAPVGGKPDRSRGEEDRFEGKAEKAKDILLNEPAADQAKPAARSPARSAGVPAGAAAPTPAYAPSPAAAPAAPRMRDYPAESAASAPSPSPPPAVKRKAWVPSEEEAQGSAVVTDDDSAQETDLKKAKSGDKTGPSLDESIRKAERLYASQDWNAAAAAYRDLINRFPGHKDAPRWRDRMNESNVAYQRTLEAKRKKVRTDDPLSGSKL
jgi:hypothetical protein